ncbi:hypothetical protein HGO21_35130 [Acinetobacter sp. CUI P1]|nr:hypothetical protein [Acinetobacter sp. CUI P1]
MANYKKYITILFLFLTFSFATHAYSAAAEKWEYDVIPDQTQRLQVTGHKVDQYGFAVNDYEYKTKIDPKTAVNRTKMGTVGMNRLLKVTGWGILGNAALQSLLEAVDWVIDPEAQSIWRYKKDNVIDYSCSGNIFSNGRWYEAKWAAPNVSPVACPKEAADNFLEKKSLSDFSGFEYKFIAWVSEPDFNKNLDGWTKRFYFTTPWGQDIANVSAEKGELAAPTQKEELTPEQLADYVNHTHSDYSNPDLAPKLAPKYSPDIASDLWKPANPFEEQNSPTVKEVEKELEKANPTPKDDKIKENQPDPETGSKSFSLPSFCSWATKVCEFADFIKKEYQAVRDVVVNYFKEPVVSDKDNELEFNDPTDDITDTSVSFSSSCPQPIVLADFNFHGIPIHWQLDFSAWCDSLSTYLKPIVIAMASFSAVLILGGVRENG